MIDLTERASFPLSVNDQDRTIVPDPGIEIRNSSIKSYQESKKVYRNQHLNTDKLLCRVYEVGLLGKLGALCRSLNLKYGFVTMESGLVGDGYVKTVGHCYPSMVNTGSYGVLRLGLGC